MTVGALVRLGLTTFRHRHLGPSDIAIVSYPKSGNTWIKFMLGDVLAGREGSFDSSEEVAPYIGSHTDAPRVLPGGGRLVKSHEPCRRPYGSRYHRAIYVVRDGRDVAVSYYFHALREARFDGEFSTFLEHFLSGSMDHYGPWHDHVRSWLEGPRSRPGALHIVRYEDTLENPARELRRLLSFVGASAPESTVAEVVDRYRFEKMRERELQSRFHARQQRQDILFMRKGEAGDWRNVFSSADETRFLRVAGRALARAGYE